MTNNDESDAFSIELKSTWGKVAAYGVVFLVVGILLVTIKQVSALVAGIIFLAAAIAEIARAAMRYRHAVLVLDERGIAYHPRLLSKRHEIGPIEWRDITRIYEQLVPMGRSNEYYLTIDVKDIEKYKTTKQLKEFDKRTRSRFIRWWYATYNAKRATAISVNFKSIRHEGTAKNLEIITMCTKIWKSQTA